MKKLLVALTFSIACVSAFSQTKIGLKGGYTHSTAHVSQYEKLKSSGYQGGYGIGVQFRAPFDGWLHFAPYIMYNRRGYTYNTGGTVDTAYRNKIHYIDIVPALSVDIPTGNNSFIAISGGFNVSVAVAGTEAKTIGGTTTSGKMTFSLSSDYGMFDLGMHSSIGFHVSKFFIEGGYNLGLADINNQYDKDGRNIRNRMLFINLGYYIR
jgi:hypothetical protein